MTAYLDKLAAIQPVSFNWKNNTATEYGLIAQDVQKVMPELVQEDSDGYLRVSYDTKLYMVMLQSIKELKAENDALKSENTNTKADIKVLKEEIQKLEISANEGK